MDNMPRVSADEVEALRTQGKSNIRLQESQQSPTAELSSTRGLQAVMLFLCYSGRTTETLTLDYSARLVVCTEIAMLPYAPLYSRAL
jgi:hypothetical protein